MNRDNSDKPKWHSDWNPKKFGDISRLGAMGKELFGRNPPKRDVLVICPGGYLEPKGIKK